MISPRVWRTLTDLNEEDAIARYKSTGRRQTAATENGPAQLPPPFASTLRWRWAWTLITLISALIWVALFLLIRWLVDA